MELTTFDKAIAGGLSTAIVAVAARVGFHADAQTVSALSVVVTAIVGYVIGHIAVYFSKNKGA